MTRFEKKQAWKIVAFMFVGLWGAFCLGHVLGVDLHDKTCEWWMIPYVLTATYVVVLLPWFLFPFEKTCPHCGAVIHDPKRHNQCQID